MNGRHLAAILWLRWRMSVHQTRRAGVVSVVLLAILVVLLVSASVGLFFVGLLGGVALLPRISPDIVMLVWDGVAAAFLLSWMTGLLAELQRSEVISLQKLLHLPISPAGAFVINYVGSLAGVSMALFVPGMIGLCIAHVLVSGPVALPMFPLLAGFLLMVTAITYQFQGWLASLMANQRRRRTVIVVVTVVFMMISQLPSLLSHHDWAGGPRRASRTEHREGGELRREDRQRTLPVVRRVNLFLPPGWLALGAMGCASGTPLPGLLGALGAALIGAASLRRSYRTTLRLYSGQFTSGPLRRPPPAADGRPVLNVVPKTAPVGISLLERRLPGLSESAAAIALASFRSLMRAPEAKMALLTPVILLLMYGAMMLTRGAAPPERARPFVAAMAAVGMVLLSLLQLAGNQFGLDRDGFRALVLSPSPRRDILLGKNLALAPPAFALGLALLVIAQFVYPTRADHLLATVAELGSTFLLFCMLANLASMLAPVPLASGTLRPAHPKAGVLLVQFGLLIVVPTLAALAALPLALELALRHLRGVSLPLYLIGSLVELAVVVWLYGRVIDWQGRLLQAREQRILEVVTAKVE